MTYKFEKLETWQLSLNYVDSAYAVGERLPKSEDFNLKSQLVRAATSVSLNITEGSTGQTDIEFSRFVGLALRSLVETVACLRLISRRRFRVDSRLMDQMERQAELLFSKLQALRKALDPQKRWVRESETVIDENSLDKTNV